VRLRLEQTTLEGSQPRQSEWIVGSDESLKGDSFGGIVVAGALFNTNEYTILESMGVVDSKDLTKKKLLEIKKLLIERFPDRFYIENLDPKEYNEHHKGNMTPLLNKLHDNCGEALKAIEPTATHVVDKYPGCIAGDVAETKAESKYLPVAAASIVASAIGKEQLEQLSENIGFKIQPGSNNVSDSLTKLKESSFLPNYYVKLHFKNVKKFFN